MPDLRSLHLRGATGPVRTEMWDGREHLVVPMVALMEGVIHAVNSPTAEYVSRAALEKSVGKWAGHPIVVGHPVGLDGKQISAHSPEVLAKHGCGFIRSSLITDSGRLVHETLIDPARLVALKQDALLADLRAGNGCEVSVGAFVDTNSTKSSFNGKAYDGEWLEIGPDHTALLPGGIGACSREMGCGAHRAAMLVTAEGFEALGGPGSGPHASTTAAFHSGHGGEANPHIKSSVMWAAHELGKQAGQRGDPLPKEVKQSRGYTMKVDGKVTPWPGEKVKGLSMNLKSLRAKMLALFDTPEQAASEEAAELIAYQSMRDLFDGVGDQWDAGSKLIDDLIADEEENPTETKQQEEAEETVETARLDAIRMHCYTMIAALQSVCNCCSDQQMPDAPPVSDPRYTEQFKALIGKAISAKNMGTIQKAHDAAHDMHSQTVALGADCKGMRVMAALPTGSQKDCPTCDGTGQVTKDKKQQDCPTCDGTGEVLKAAEDFVSSVLRTAACRCEEDGMTKTERIAALLALSGANFTACQTDMLTNVVPEAQIATLHTLAAKSPADSIIQAKYAADSALAGHAHGLNAAEQAAADKEAAKKKADDVKAAEAKTPEARAAAQAAFYAENPEIKALVDRQKQQDDAEKTGLVTKLAAASKALTVEQLNAKPLDELRTLATYAKVETVDYSIKGVPVPRSAENASEFTPPDPYNLKALQGGDKKAAVN
jgi:hypothetical protein